MRLLAIAIFALFSVPVAVAQLYVCPKAGGGVSLTSTPTRADCQLQQSFQRGSERKKQPSPELAPATTKKPAKKPTTSKSRKYPVVSPATQKVRDKKRMEILLYELQKEEQQEQTTQQLIEEIKTQTPSQAELLPHFEEKLTIHSQNIIAIKQELARL